MIATALTRSNIIPAPAARTVGVSNPVTGTGRLVGEGVEEAEAKGVGVGVDVPGISVACGVGVVFPMMTIGVGLGLPAIVSVMVYEPVLTGVNKISEVSDFLVILLF